MEFATVHAIFLHVSFLRESSNCYINQLPQAHSFSNHSIGFIYLFILKNDYSLFLLRFKDAAYLESYADSQLFSSALHHPIILFFEFQVNL
jgi:hypothetical protein